MNLPGTATRRADGTLEWQPGRELTADERTAAYQAGFTREPGTHNWTAKRTPQREAFLLRFVNEVQREQPSPTAVTPFALDLVKPNGTPLAELLDVNLNRTRRTLTLTIQDGERTVKERIPMYRSRAGLAGYVETSGVVMFTHGLPKDEPVKFKRGTPPISGTYRCERGLAEALHFLLTGVAVCFSDWPQREGLHPAHEQTLLNAAD